MTRADLDAIVAWWRPRLGLAGWELRVVWEPDEHGDDGPDFGESSSHAYTWRARDYDSARIYFNPSEHEKWGRREANAIAVHELLHLATRDIEFVLDLVDGHLHRDSDELLTRSHRHAVEGAVDRLAYRLADLVAELGELPPAEKRR